jgi:hypothetical protein
MSAQDTPDLLLAEATTRAPALAGGVALATARGQPTTPMPGRDRLWSDRDHPNDLAIQRWTVIAPIGPEGDAMLAALAPLINARAAEQRAPVVPYRVPPRMTADAAARWKREVFYPSQRHFEDLPRYQLILGDLHQVSHELQVSQATDGFVGRLAFDRLDHYTAYAAKLLAAERTPPASSARRALFHGVLDGTSATDTGDHGLIRPCVDLARQLRARDPARFPAEPLVTGAGPPDPNALLTAARAHDPGVLLSLSHGLGAPRNGWPTPAEQRAVQGAMSFGRAGALRGDDLARVPFMPAGVWFMFACFSAGTPQTSKYLRWISELAAQGRFPGRPELVLASLPPAGHDPFVASIPRVVLANPNGPLAFIGHLDLAWTYSFREVDLARPIQQSGRFFETIAAILRGDRVGAAFRELFRWFESVNTELAAIDETGTAQPARRAQLWLLRQDLAGFMLLGDPAARLAPPPAPDLSPKPAPDLDPASFFGGMTILPSTPAAARPDLAALERAIGQLLAGATTLERAAADLRLPPADLRDLLDRYRKAGRAAIGR